eukprot:1188575-Prorocentrum_minimum.AAC.2
MDQWGECSNSPAVKGLNKDLVCMASPRRHLLQPMVRHGPPNGDTKLDSDCSLVRIYPRLLRVNGLAERTLPGKPKRPRSARRVSSSRHHRMSTLSFTISAAYLRIEGSSMVLALTAM